MITDSNDIECIRGESEYMFFDVFTTHQWSEGYTLGVGIARPANAPRHRMTKADVERNISVNKKNQELAGRMFTSLEEVFEEIKRLQLPEEE